MPYIGRLYSTDDLNTAATSEGSYLLTTASMPNAPKGLADGGGGSLFVDVVDTRHRHQTIKQIHSARSWWRSIDPAPSPAIITPWRSPNGVVDQVIPVLGDSRVMREFWLPAARERIQGPLLVNGGVGGTCLSYSTSPGAADELSGVRIVDAICAYVNPSTSAHAWDTVDAAVITEAAIPAPNTVDASTQIANLKAVDWPSVRAVVIGHLTNDYGLNRPLGCEDSWLPGKPDDLYTVAGATNYIIKKFGSINIKPIFLLPIFRSRLTSTGTPGTQDSDVTFNAQGLPLSAYSNMMERICSRQHVPCGRIGQLAGINRYNCSFNISDGIHDDLLTGGVQSGNAAADFIASVV